MVPCLEQLLLEAIALASDKDIVSPEGATQVGSKGVIGAKTPVHLQFISAVFVAAATTQAGLQFSFIVFGTKPNHHVPVFSLH